MYQYVPLLLHQLVITTLLLFWNSFILNKSFYGLTWSFSLSHYLSFFSCTSGLSGGSQFTFSLSVTVLAGCLLFDSFVNLFKHFLNFLSFNSLSFCHAFWHDRKEHFIQTNVNRIVTRPDFPSPLPQPQTLFALRLLTYLKRMFSLRCLHRHPPQHKARYQAAELTKPINWVLIA